ncbi:response regulator [Geoalkalibacter sp.]|uniref:response regulator n=1 Tax=Geoalkalibacter sp. TaxID=3041440 RepID=UPI00272E7896|nr:response regulator [Geoalkalibacter sp.]
MASAPERILSPATNTPPLPDLRGRRVLVVADCAESRDLLYEMIVLWGGECLEVQSGDEALACTRLSLARGLLFDLIIIDLNSAGAKGLSTARRLAVETALVKIPVLFLNDEPCPPPDAAGSAAFCVEKPLRLVDLQDAVSKVLCGRIFGFPRRTKAWLTAGPAPLRQRVLLVAEGPANEKLVSTLLSKRGHQVTRADNGRAALDLLSRQIFDMLLLDMHLPTQDVVQLAQAIRRGDRVACDPRIPIIALTVHLCEEGSRRFLDAGVDRCLAKPFQVQELLALVESYAPAENPKDQDEVPSL